MRIVTSLNDVNYKNEYATISKVEEEKRVLGKTKVKLIGYSFAIDYPEGVRVFGWYKTEQECREEALAKLVFVEDYYKKYI